MRRGAPLRIDEIHRLTRFAPRGARLKPRNTERSIGRNRDFALAISPAFSTVNVAVDAAAAPYEPVKKQDVYNVVESFIQDRIDSRGKGVLWFYSISTCFGFYSEGMKRFVSMVDKLEQVGLYSGRSSTDRRLLLNIDSNAVDQHAIRRMKVIFANDFSQIIRSLEIAEAETLTRGAQLDVDPYIQYFIGGLPGQEKLLVTEIQTTVRDRILGLQLNKLAEGRLYSADSAQLIIELHKRHFQLVWESMVTPRIDDPQLSLDIVENKLAEFSIPRIEDLNEDEIGFRLEYYLKGIFGSRCVESQYAQGHCRYDVVLGGTNKNEIAVELKVALDSAEEKRLRGQIQEYSKNPVKLVVLLIRPKISERQEAILRQDFRDVRFVKLY